MATTADQRDDGEPVESWVGADGGGADAAVTSAPDEDADPGCVACDGVGADIDGVAGGEVATDAAVAPPEPWFDRFMAMVGAQGLAQSDVQEIARIKTIDDIMVILKRHIKTRHTLYKAPSITMEALGIKGYYSLYHERRLEQIIELIRLEKMSDAIDLFRALVEVGYTAGYIEPRFKTIKAACKHIGERDVHKWYRGEWEKIQSAFNTVCCGEELGSQEIKEVTYRISLFTVIKTFVVEATYAELIFLGRRAVCHPGSASNYRDEIERIAELKSMKDYVDKEACNQIRLLSRYTDAISHNYKNDNNNWFIIHDENIIEVIPRKGSEPIIRRPRTFAPLNKAGSGWIFTSSHDAITAIKIFVVDCCKLGTYDDDLIALKRRLRERGGEGKK